MIHNGYAILPVRFAEVLAGVDLSQKQRAEMELLLSRKAVAAEREGAIRLPALDRLVED